MIAGQYNTDVKINPYNWTEIGEQKPNVGDFVRIL